MFLAINQERAQKSETDSHSHDRPRAGQDVFVFQTLRVIPLGTMSSDFSEFLFLMFQFPGFLPFAWENT